MSSTTLKVGAALVAGIGIGFAIQSNPQQPLMQANLYMQNSAEYRALCIQTYAWSESLLRVKSRAAKATMERAHQNKPLAVVMDLDETVVDNSAFQSYLDRESKEYSEADWHRYEQTPGDVGLVPGALEFIRSAEAMGVQPVYISNRWTKNQTHTIEALRRLGINVNGIEHRLLLREEGKSSNKDERRAVAEKLYHVLMYFGDNLRDFSEAFVAPSAPATDYAALQKGVATRKAAVDKYASKFGSEWIVLPNPVYGEFDKLKGQDPRKMLKPSSMK